MITYTKGDMFKRNGSDKVFVHACNAKGVWGAGIALQFKRYYPLAYRIYSHWCEINKHKVVGKCLLINDSGVLIGCLVTSNGYGARKDSEDRILRATYQSVIDLIQQMSSWKTIVSPKINNGYFGIPWEKTEQSINQAIQQSGEQVMWNVYDLQ